MKNANTEDRDSGTESDDENAELQDIEGISHIQVLEFCLWCQEVDIFVSSVILIHINFKIWVFPSNNKMLLLICCKYY